MKKNFSKIILIIIILVLLIGGFYLYQNLTKKSPSIPSQPAQLTEFNQLPFENSHFQITYDASQNVLTVIPNTPFDMSQPPLDFFKQNWTTYQAYGVEALQWLETHQLGQAFRTNFGVTILWWGQEWWPQNATAPKI